MHPNEHSIERGANFYKVIELLMQLKIILQKSWIKSITKNDISYN